MTTMSSAEVPEYGLTVLYQPEGRNPSADIIFVHGLQGHPQRTWQSSKDSCSPRAIYWPRDLLSHDRGDARILTYGYDSRISHFFTGPANQMNISQHGEALLNSVAGERLRSKLQGRPIIFVAHSLGGLLVKEALIESKKQQYNPGKTDIYASTQAIVFFGTPHMGSNDVKWGLLVQRIASVAFNTNGKILRGLGVDSELLDRLARDFQDVLDSGKLRVCSFQEAVGKAGLPIFNGKVSLTALFSVGRVNYTRFFESICQAILLSCLLRSCIPNHQCRLNFGLRFVERISQCLCSTDTFQLLSMIVACRPVGQRGAYVFL